MRDPRENKYYWALVVLGRESDLLRGQIKTIRNMGSHAVRIYGHLSDYEQRLRQVHEAISLLEEAGYED